MNNDHLHRIPKRPPPWIASLAWFGCWLAAMGLNVAHGANTLTDIEYTALPGDRVHITLTLAEPIEEPRSFTIDNPPRIALDLPDTSSQVSPRTQEIDVGVARQISAVQGRDRTRVVINLLQLVAFDTRVEDNRIHLVLERRAGDRPRITGRVDEEMEPAEVRDDPQRKRVEDVDFRRGEEDEGRVTVRLSDPSTVVDVDRDDGRIVVDFVDAELAENLERRLDVTDFATPVQRIDTYQHDRGVRMEIEPRGDFEHMAYQSDRQFTVEFRPLTPEEKEVRERERAEYTGERLSLNFQDIAVREVLQILADFKDLNLVVSDSVTGSITLRLEQVPWDHALDIILETRDLGMRQTDNVIQIWPADELADRELRQRRREREVAEEAPLRAAFIQVNYARASEMASLIQQPDVSLLSDRGTVTIDERTNTLLVQDTPERLDEVRGLVSRLDTPMRQVLIESRIVIASDDFARDLGARFGASARDSDSRAIFGGTQPGTTDFGDTTGFSGTDADIGTAHASPQFDEGLIVSLPAAADPAAAVGLSIGRIGSRLLQLELSAMQVEGQGEIVSSPRVITASNQEAVIRQGVEIPFQEATAAGATSVSFRDAVLSLRVTPRITPDDRVIMDLAVNKSNVGEVVPVGTGTAPSIDTQEVTTQVLVDNGETVVLGGIYEQERRERIDRVPFFGNLPGVGRLFRRTSTADEKSELLIFVTPRIIRDGMQVEPQMDGFGETLSQPTAANPE